MNLCESFKRWDLSIIHTPRIVLGIPSFIIVGFFRHYPSVLTLISRFFTFRPVKLHDQSDSRASAESCNVKDNGAPRESKLREHIRPLTDVNSISLEN